MTPRRIRIRRKPPVIVRVDTRHLTYGEAEHISKTMKRAFRGRPILVHDDRVQVIP